MLTIDYLKKYISLLVILIFITSCLKTSESITPLATPKTLAQLQREALMLSNAESAGTSAFSVSSISKLELTTDPSLYYLNLTYYVKDIDVFQVANIPNTFEQLGHSFLLSAAKFVLAILGPQEININQISLTIPDFSLDRSIVKSIKIKRISIQYANSVEVTNDYSADFSFINSLDLTMPVVVPHIGTIDQLLLSYQKSQNYCLFKCIQFNIFTDNVLDLITPNSNLHLTPTISVGSIPSVTNLKLDGQIEIQIGLKLPF